MIQLGEAFIITIAHSFEGSPNLPMNTQGRTQTVSCSGDTGNLTDAEIPGQYIFFPQKRLAGMMRDGGYDLFLSYARSDGAAAAELNGWLRAQGLRTFFDRNELRPGLRWVSALEDAISRSDSVAILVGRHGIGNTQQYERELALVRQTHDAGFPVIPVLMPGCENPPTGFLQLLTWVDLSQADSVLKQTEGLSGTLPGNPTAGGTAAANPCANLPLQRPRAIPGRRCCILLWSRRRDPRSCCTSGGTFLRCGRWSLGQRQVFACIRRPASCIASAT